jgi:Domain of unknown function (DUF4387)
LNENTFLRTIAAAQGAHDRTDHYAMKLTDAATVIRSKNAGPLQITIDLMFEDEARFDLARQSPSLSPSNLATLYGLQQDSVQVLPFPQALAIKLVFDRKTVAGDPGDRDVYGTQQHGPLLGIEL